MSRPAIRLEHVWKRFRLGLTRRRQKQNLRDLMTRDPALARRGDPQLAGLADPRLTRYIWALADVSFQVQEGEAVGIIGPNGSGKSTTLRLVSRVSRPWSGLVEARGRVGALIELKAGLHPELTGRENIFLYGSLLGLRRKEIRRRFDQIVEFAELHRFIDTPLKRFSSGMEVRLGFSVAVHLDPDILLIDEVLAVGDAAFQQRCLARMDELRAEGQTIVFVSHELNQVRRLCPRTILLDRGQIRADGPTDEIIDGYLSEVLPSGQAADARLSGP